MRKDGSCLLCDVVRANWDPGDRAQDLASSDIFLDTAGYTSTPSGILFNIIRTYAPDRKLNSSGTHRGGMVCEVMPDTLLYGTMSLLSVCATTAMVPAF
jgi:hypothetical protein